MAKIYNDREETLNDLLSKAGREAGATLLIPELQRPYVWRPEQVVTLVDSLMRGWPFGTLLLWKVTDTELTSIPSRPFWKLVDRTKEEGGEKVSKQGAPAEYQMVLDGQQRVQSLLLAFYGDIWGFKMFDHDWAVELGSRSQRGKKAQHWSKGSLCLHLEAFLKAYESSGEMIHDMDFRSALAWAITDQTADGQSVAKKPESVRPLTCAHPAPPGAHAIRLSRLWDTANFQAGTSSKLIQKALAEKVLPQYELEPGFLEKITPPLADFVMRLSAVKQATIRFLELSAFDASGISDRNSYNDAVVNIFARLNTGGRTLTREEITFAWIKSGWNETGTQTVDAGDAFFQLRSELAALSLELTTDELVGAVSFLWSVAFREGKRLEDRDLLDGRTIKPMARELAGAWSQVRHALLSTVSMVADRGLVLGEHYRSLNALLVLCGWAFLAERWKAGKPAVEQHAIETLCKEAMNECGDRWLLCSQWADKWGYASKQYLDTLAAELSKDLLAASATGAGAVAGDILKSRLKQWCQELAQDAVSYLRALDAGEDRAAVREYFGPLFIWHRLDKERWEMSQIPLRTGQRQKIKTEVDHVVSVGLWKTKPAPTATVNADDWLAVANQIGNTLLLEKGFNIAKRTDPLGGFLAKLIDFKPGAASTTPPIDRNTWIVALGLQPDQVDSSHVTGERLAACISERTKVMKDELEKYARGELVRQDV